MVDGRRWQRIGSQYVQAEGHACHALAIAALGANGTTRSQLNELLGSGSLTDSDYQSLLSSINGQYSGAKSEMSAANSLWIDDDYSLASDYQSTVKKMFEAEVTTLPFDDQAAAKMSDWIAKHTNGSLKPKITLRDREVLSIINTVYADGRSKSSPPATAPSTAKPEMLRCR